MSRPAHCRTPLFRSATACRRRPTGDTPLGSDRWRGVALALTVFLSSVVFSTVSVSPTRAANPGYFGTLPPGSALPDDAACAARVRRHPWEPRPENLEANSRLPAAAALATYRSTPWGNADHYHGRVTGGFTGTTDEILQWAACKWGFDEETVRAQAVKESGWRQAAVGDWEEGDCPDGSPGVCPHSFGLLQVRWNADRGSRGTFPLARDGTAFAVDYALAVWRACYEGYEVWLNDVERGQQYAAGDEWGCVGRWYAGRWYVNGAVEYVGAVQQHRAALTWRTIRFVR